MWSFLLTELGEKNEFEIPFLLFSISTLINSWIRTLDISKRCVSREFLDAYLSR